MGFFSVSEFSMMLQRRLASCIVSTSKVRGVICETAQAEFIKMMSKGVPALTALTSNHQLTMWLANTVFTDFIKCSSINSSSSSSSSSVGGGSSSSSGGGISSSRVISPDEIDVVSYIGGFVICKLKQRNKLGMGYTMILEAMESEEEPNPKTLVAAKSRGRLINLNKDGQSLFLELECIFRDLYSLFIANVSVSEYTEKCISNDIVQNCFHSATHSMENVKFKDSVLSGIIKLFFKIRVHHKCRCIVEKLRNKKLDSKKEKSLRTKLTK